MSNTDIIPIILCGGSGTRLSPISNPLYPKQFVKFHNNTSLFQLTLLRARFCSANSKVIIITNIRYKNIVNSQLNEIKFKNFQILYEERKCNTNISVIFGLLYIQHILSISKISGDSKSIKATYVRHNLENSKIENTLNRQVIIMPSDHYFDSNYTLRKAIYRAKRHILNKPKSILLFGSKAKFPMNEFGYINCDRQKKYNKEEHKIDNVRFFVEKPNFRNALHYMNNYSCYWNSGIYMANLSLLIHKMHEYSSEIYEICSHIFRQNINKKDLKENAIIINDYGLLAEFSNEKSFDKSVTEKCKNLFVQPIRTKWFDLGSWSSVYEMIYNST